MGEYADYMIDDLISESLFEPKRNKMAYRHQKKTYKTKYYKFTGLVSYPKVYEPDEYNNSEFWKVNLHPDADTIDEIQKTGVRLKLKPSNEDYSTVKGPFFTFRRPTTKKFGDKVQEFNPPEIFDKDGSGIMTYHEDQADGKKVLIGNGSKCEIEVEVYDAGAFKGHRLKSLKILDLISYDPDAKEEVAEKGEDEVVKETTGKVSEPEEKVSKKVAW